MKYSAEVNPNEHCCNSLERILVAPYNWLFPEVPRIVARPGECFVRVSLGFLILL